MFKKTIAAAALLVASVAGANTANAQNFHGAYFGGYAGAWDGDWYGGLAGGVDIQFGQFMAGIGMRNHMTFEYSTFSIEGIARAGLVIMDNVALYGIAGIGTVIPAGFPYAEWGGGIEFGLSDRAHMFAEGTMGYDINCDCLMGPTLRGGVIIRR